MADVFRRGWPSSRKWSTALQIASTLPHGFHSRMVEMRLKPKADFAAIVRHENAISPGLNGRTVLDGRRRRRIVNPRQGSLF